MTPSRRALMAVAGLLTLGIIGACAGGPAVAPEAAGEVVVKKSPNDNRDYRYLVLDNELRVLLVNDPDTDKAAASLTVLRGSYHEPAEYQGLAHFLEHMLFIGTAKYPEIDGYQQFVATHGGSSNAYTAAEETNYFFDINPEQFRAGMDRFAQFFISPLLDPAYVDREKNAVNSEYQLQIKDDGWRGFSATKAAMNPAYPGSRFNIGSLDTLDEGVGEALVEFFENNYSADQMVLVALSNEPLDELQAWVAPMFGAIENRSLGAARNSIRAFTDDQLPAVLNVQTLKDQYHVTFSFPVPATEPYYRKKPAQYLTNLLGHEGEGSLHEHLTQKGWISALGAGVNRLDDANAYLAIDIELTASGKDAVPAIARALFGYIELLKRNDPERWRYEEQAVSADLNFRFQEKSSATAFVYLTAPALALYPPEDVLAAPYLMESFDPQLINAYLGYLTPDNLIVTVSGPDVATNAVERWFQVPYQLERRYVADGAPEPARMHLPAANPFLPDDLELLAGDTLGPTLGIDEPGLELWLDQDVEFGVPRANQYFTIGVRDGLRSAAEVATARIYARLLRDSLNGYAYPAQLAGLGYQLSVVPAGFRLGLSGYADKQPELLDTVLERFVTLTVDPERFALFQEELIRDWRNFSNERPYTQTYAALANVLVTSSFSPEELADAAEDITVTALEAWREQRLSALSVVGLSHGNLDRAALEETARLLTERLPVEGFEISRPSVVSVTQPYVLSLEIEHDDASMVLYAQDADASFAARAQSALAAQMLRQQFFTSLRTEQQLGYVVAVTNRTLRDRGGLAFIVQSPVASPAALEDATRQFMQEQLPFIEAMSSAEFEQQKAGLISRLTERDKNLRERTTRYLADLDVDETGFDSQARIAEIVAGLSQADMRSFYEGLLARLDERRVLIYSLGRFSDAPDGVPLPRVDALKAD